MPLRPILLLACLLATTPAWAIKVHKVEIKGLRDEAMEANVRSALSLSDELDRDLRARRLVSAAPPGSQDLQMVMDVRAYREKPTAKDAVKGTAQALWDYLLEQAGAHPDAMLA